MRSPLFREMFPLSCRLTICHFYYKKEIEKLNCIWIVTYREISFSSTSCCELNTSQVVLQLRNCSFLFLQRKRKTSVYGSDVRNCITTYYYAFEPLLRFKDIKKDAFLEHEVLRLSPHKLECTNNVTCKTSLDWKSLKTEEVKRNLLLICLIDFALKWSHAKGLFI